LGKGKGEGVGKMNDRERNKLRTFSQARNFIQDEIDHRATTGRRFDAYFKEWSDEMLQREVDAYRALINDILKKYEGKS
jgi:AraC-like DNA-binding protein